MWIRKANQFIGILRRVRASVFLSNSLVYLLSNIISSGLLFLLVPILTRYLSKTEYGELAVFQTLVIGFSAFIGLSSQGAANNAFYDKKINLKGYGEFIGNCLIILIITMAVTILLLTISYGWLSSILNISARLILLALFVASLNFVVLVRMGQWQLRKKVKNYVLFQISQNFFNVLASIVVVTYYLKGGLGRVYVLFSVSLCYAIISIYLLHREKLLIFSFNSSYQKEIFKFGSPLILHSLGFFLISSVDRLILNDKLGLEDVAIYALASQIVGIMSLTFDGINNAYVPWLYEKLKRNLMEEKLRIVRYTYIYMVVLLAIVLAVFVSAPFVIPLIAGKGYMEAVPILWILALGQAFHGMYLMVTNYVFFSRKTIKLAMSTAFSGAMNFLLLLVLVVPFGIKGAAVAYVIGMALKFFLTWYIAAKQFPMPWFNLSLIWSKNV
jgi:O-antigen/teichoic acid export membrane protein